MNAQKIKPKRKKKTCYCKWKIDDVVANLNDLRRQVDYLKQSIIETKIVIYSADNDICIGMHNSLWHRIVCQYEGNICLGGPRDHWQSTWKVDEKGFHLEEFVDGHWKGWKGQYKEGNELKYDELPRDVLALHHNKLCDHIQHMAIFYPCHIYNDFTGELHRP